VRDGDAGIGARPVLVVNFCPGARLGDRIGMRRICVPWGASKAVTAEVARNRDGFANLTPLRGDFIGRVPRNGLFFSVAGMSGPCNLSKDFDMSRRCELTEKGLCRATRSAIRTSRPSGAFCRT